MGSSAKEACVCAWFCMCAACVDAGGKDGAPRLVERPEEPMSKGAWLEARDCAAIPGY